MLLWLIAYRLAQANAERVKKLEDELAERRAKDETTEKRQKRRDRLAELIYKGDGLLLVCDTEDPNAKYNEWRDEIMKYVREEFGATEVMLFDDLNMEMQTFRAAPVIKYQIEWGVISSDIQGLKALVKRYAD